MRAVTCRRTWTDSPSLPTAAPGVFVSVHPEGLYVYRLRVNFSSGTASKTLQAIVPVAPWTGACCIPQPGTDRHLDPSATT
jgi:hypothetical protein